MFTIVQAICTSKTSRKKSYEIETNVTIVHMSCDNVAIKKNICSYAYIYIVYIYIYIVYIWLKTHKIIKSTNISLLFRSFVNRCIVRMYSQSNLLDRILRQHSYQPCPQDFFNNIQYNPHDGMLRILIGVI